MSSSLIPNHLFNSQESPITRPGLQSENERLKLLLDMTNVLVSNLKCRDVLRAVSAIIRQVMRYDVVGVWVPDSEQVLLRQLAMDFPESNGFVTEDSVQPVEGSIVGRVFKTGKPIVLDVIGEQVAPEEARQVHAEALESGCALPLISRGRTLGVLTLGSRVENSVSPEDVDFLLQAAGQVAIAIENALAYREIAELKDKLAQEKLYLEDEIRGEMDFEGIVGQSSALRHVLNLVETVAPSDSTVLLLGETGTGKELIARAIHERSRRKERTLVKLNCAAIPTGLLESELFGHERGAFTGAIAQKTGRFELAHGGTLFLDEIGDIPAELQPKLLRVLQEQEFERLGGTQTMRVNVRVVAATSRDLPQMMANREFRSDLYYRLSVFPVRLPALRERSEDIPLLVRHFVDLCAKRMNKQIERVPQEAIQALLTYPWPGNVRELQNFIERAVILSPGKVLRLPLSELDQHNSFADIPGQIPGSRLTLKDANREHIIQALAENNWIIGGLKGAAAR